VIANRTLNRCAGFRRWAGIGFTTDAAAYRIGTAACLATSTPNPEDREAGRTMFRDRARAALAGPEPGPPDPAPSRPLPCVAPHRGTETLKDKRLKVQSLVCRVSTKRSVVAPAARPSR